MAIPDNEQLRLNDDYYSEMSEMGFSKKEADSLADLLTKCWRRDGKFGAVVGGGVGFALGGTVSLGSLAVPGWVLGFALGGTEGTAVCAFKPVKVMAKHELQRLKLQIKRILDFRFLTDPLAEISGD